MSGDCAVDFQDLTRFGAYWLDQAGCAGESNCADFNGSGRVDMADFSLAAANWQTKWPQLIISEFMAGNQNSIQDGHGDRPDWIEVFNPTEEPIALDGWYLTNDAGDLKKWRFPDGKTIEPGRHDLLFASEKTESVFPENYPYLDPSGYLHTNFNLRSSGSYLAVVRPDGTVSFEYTPRYPPQYEDISYGKGGLSDVVTIEHVLVDEFCPAAALVPSDDSLGIAWTDVEFDDAGWKSGSTGVGYDNQTTYDLLIGLDVAEMYGVNGSVYIRVPFTVDDPSVYDELLLQMKYDDGFIAYLNGLPVESANPPADPQWNSDSEGGHPDSEAMQFADYPIDDFIDVLGVGRNVLAIHGVNNGAGSSDMLILPKLIARYTTTGNVSGLSEGYFTAPTPRSGNSQITVNVGPRISDATKNPAPPLEDENLVVSAWVTSTEHPVQSVTLNYRIGYGPEVSIPMHDDGPAGDRAAQDDIFTAVVPSTSFQVGDMIRWYVSAQDTQGQTSRFPLFPDAAGSDEYLGTMVRDPSVVTAMPVLYWFLQPGTESAADTRTGTRASVFYNGEFYDNVFVRIRGGSIAGLNKKSYKFEFNTSNHFRFDQRFGRVDEININTTYTDKTYIRQSLSFQTYDWAGLGAPESFPVRVQRNGEFFSVAAFIEQPDNDMLEREGLDDQGALYKMYNGVTSSSAQKKNRRWEDNSDLADLVANINNLSGQNRTNYIFDNINIPAVLNFLAASILIQNDDDSKKNYYLYRDTNGSGEWMFLPWDLDLTFGKHYMSKDSILTDIIWAVEDYILGGRNQNVPIWPSHPFVDTQQTPGNRSWNHLTDALLNTPEFVEMYRRRLRTLMDEILQAPGTDPALLRYENRINEMASQIAADVAIDRAGWGWYGQSQTLTEAIYILIRQYLEVRRTHLFRTHNKDNVAGYNIPNSFSAEIPNAQPDTLNIDFGAVDFNPPSANQDDEYIELKNVNSFAADISGWRLTGGVGFVFKPGTVIRSGGSLYVSPNVRAFRARSTSPTGGQGHFVQGNYTGHLSSWGETITLFDNTDTVVNSISYEGAPSDAQRYLRITEIMYHPHEGDQYAAEEYEFIELQNTGPVSLSLDNVKFTEGIDYAFADGGNVNLPAGGYILLVRNRTAFESRYGAGFNIAGEYSGFLDNGGERVKLEDSTNSTILECSFGDWFGITDGLGFSLTIRDVANPDLDSWDSKSGWRPSEEIDGSPGADDPDSIPELGSIVINEVLAHSHAAAADWIELYNTTEDQVINIGGWFLSDSANDLKKYEIPEGTVIEPNDYVVFYEHLHFGDPNAEGCHTPFAVSENGETIYLTSGKDGELTGYTDDEDFGASERDVSFGRYQKTTGAFNFVAMSEQTRKAANADPKVGPVVISEIMYHPAGGGTFDKEEYEYIELYNTTDSAAPLYEYDADAGHNIPWKFTDGIEYTFPPGTEIGPHGYLLVVRNTTAFAERHGSPAGVEVLGPYDKKLNNDGEKLELAMPGDTDEEGRHYIRIDRVVYNDAGGWPITPDGAGMSLTRTNKTAYGNDVINWHAADPTPGN